MREHSNRKSRKPASRRRILLIYFVCLLFLPVYSFSEEQSVLPVGFSREEVNQGKRFFMGLLPVGRTHDACVSCHNIAPTDTLNWNPSAMDIALKYAGKDAESLRRVILEPSGKLMEASHVNIKIDDEDIQLIKVYLDHMAANGLPAAKPSVNRLILFLFLGLLITWALLDLIIFKRVKYKFIPALIFLGAFSYQLVMIYNEAVKLGRSQDYQPDQPVKFSHKVHALDNQIDCMYCHHTAPVAKTANFPSTELCMNCHIIVREGTHSGKFEIDKLIQAHEEGRSIEWIRVHELPDHVFFSHAQHVGAGKLDCAQCHGLVEEMDIVKQHSDLSMGWCLECNREPKVDFLDSDYYKTFEAFLEELKKGMKASIVADVIGANDCQKCHY